MTSQKRIFDAVVFGASGYTGQYVVEKLAVVAARENLTWAIAGRNKRKLEECLAEADKQVGSKVPNSKLKETPIIISDVADEQSLVEMAKQTKLVLNCVGPYALYGEPVVRACVANGTSHLDMSGEPQYLEKMVLKYDREAEERGAFVVGSCGFGSTAIETGIQYVEEQFAPGEVNDIEAYVQMHSGPAGYTMNFGTLISGINVVANFREMLEVNKQLLAYENVELPKPEYHPPGRAPVHRRSDLNCWAVAAAGSDPVVQRTQRTLYRLTQHRPIQVVPYTRVNTFYGAMKFFCSMISLLIFSLIPFTRRLILKYPKFFTGGFFTTDGPTREQVSQASFSYDFVARGWHSKNENEVKNAPSRKLHVRLDGREFAYVTAALCLVEGGVSVLKERDRIGLRGGVLTAGVALRNTSFLKRVQSAEDGFRLQVKEL